MNVATGAPHDVVYTPEGQALRREDIKTLLDQMRFELGRFRAWRCHHDPEFKPFFDAVQKWQAGRLLHTHRDLIADLRYQAITQFFLKELYGGMDLTELAREVERALPIANRLLPDAVMRTSAIALELNALTGELDEVAATYLYEKYGKVELNNTLLREAFLACDTLALRHHQMALLSELANGLDKYVRSRVIFATFKIAHRPAKLAGLAGLYEFLGRGFEVMRPMGSAQEFTKAFIAEELAVWEALYDGDPLAFDL